MTQVITRYFESASAAATAKKSLQFEGFPRQDLMLLTDADDLVDTLTAEEVEKDTAKAYGKKLKTGGAVLVAKATYKPLGAARLVRQVVSDMGAADMGDVTEEVYVRDVPRSGGGTILTSHPLMLSRRPGEKRSNNYMADWPIPLTNRRKPVDAFAFPRHARMANFPIPLLSRRKPKDNFAFPRHARMAAFPIPLLSKRVPADKFAFPRHKRMADFPIPLISKREPYTGTAIGRHTRMANWPFPLLINGETGTNSLIPGGTRMANFPIPLISKREPSDNFAFERHKRMANWPVALTNRRKPFTGSAIPKHGRMADAILPLIIKHGEERGAAKGKGFSFSAMLGLPTLKSR